MHEGDTESAQELGVFTQDNDEEWVSDSFDLEYNEVSVIED